jgi:hypothetical protein
MTKDGLRGKEFNRKGTQRISQRNAKLPNRRGPYFGYATTKSHEAEILVAQFRVISWIVSVRQEKASKRIST